MTSKYYLLALANEIEGTPLRLYADAFRNSGAKIETQAARIAELEAALLNLIEHTLDCEIELNKLHGLGAGTSSVLCEAHAALEGGK